MEGKKKKKKKKKKKEKNQILQEFKDRFSAKKFWRISVLQRGILSNFPGEKKNLTPLKILLKQVSSTTFTLQSVSRLQILLALLDWGVGC